MTAQRLYDELHDVGIVGVEAELSFTLSGITTVVADKSVYGNVIQAWLKSFMNSHAIPYREGEDSQSPPDFYMGNGDRTGLLEVKCFTGQANFDISNFMAYCRLLAEKPWHLDADYLIFEYSTDPEDFTMKIERIWLKKVWEICGPSDRSEIKCQWKNNVLYNIRPIAWYSENPQYLPFNDWRLMLESVYRVLRTQPAAAGMGDWLGLVTQGFESHLNNE